MSSSTIRIKLGGKNALSKDAHSTIDLIDWDLQDMSWFLTSDGYASGGKRGKLHRFVLARVMNRDLRSDEVSDHINGDKLDNRRCNLRAVSQAENMKNRSMRSRANKSGVLNVHRCASASSWAVRIRTGGVMYNCGTYKTIDRATEVARIKRAELGLPVR